MSGPSHEVVSFDTLRLDALSKRLAILRAVHYLKSSAYDDEPREKVLRKPYQGAVATSSVHNWRSHRSLL